MTAIETTKSLLHKYFIPAVLSLLVGMINTYHKEAREQRQTNLEAVNEAILVNTRQDEKLATIAKNVEDINNRLRDLKR